MSVPPRRRLSISLLVPFTVLAVLMGSMIYMKYRASREIPSAPQGQEARGPRTVVLFFLSPEGTGLSREAREIDQCGEVNECASAVVEELMNGPVGVLEDTIPEGTVVNAVRLEGSTAVVDLNGTFPEALPSGSSAEMTAVYSIVNSICLNVPQVTRVHLTIDGNRSSVLRHLDLSGPLAPDYSLETGGAPMAVPPARGADDAARKGEQR